MLKTVLPYIASSMTLLGMWLISQKRSVGWIVGLINQGIWILFDFMYNAFGLLPLQLVLIVIYTNALIKWRRDEIIVAAIVIEE
jgi:nicotinamide riboside transporter PnuC